MKIKPPSVAGKFYTDNKEELLNQLDNFIQNSKKACNYFSRAIIVPHAGYDYSGQLACEGFQYLDKNVKNIFIIAPPHYVPVIGASLSSYEFWATPLGEIEVNQQINEELIEKFGCEFQNNTFEYEHSTEVQVPFIQKMFPEAKIIPIIANNPQKISEIISYYLNNPQNGFVISSDLSHFNHSTEAQRMDEITAKMIEFKAADQIIPVQACGACGIQALVNVAKNKNYSLLRVGMHNSGDITNDKKSVVGYGAWFLYEGSKNTFLKKYFSPLIIDICKKSILSKLENSNFTIDNIPAFFNEFGASFVTIEKNDDLRGCIGSIIAHQPLVYDLVRNAQNAAFSDPRFHPLEQDELEEISIKVSLLSEPEKMNFENEPDLLEQIKPFSDGIIIKDGDKQAVYLPSVWEQIPDKKFFLKSLKIKAGMTPEHFSNTFEAYRFYTEYIEEQ